MRLEGRSGKGEREELSQELSRGPAVFSEREIFRKLGALELSGINQQEGKLLMGSVNNCAFDPPKNELATFSLPSPPSAQPFLPPSQNLSNQLLKDPAVPIRRQSSVSCAPSSQAVDVLRNKARRKVATRLVSSLSSTKRKEGRNARGRPLEQYRTVWHWRG